MTIQSNDELIKQLKELNKLLRLKLLLDHNLITRKDLLDALGIDSNAWMKERYGI